LRRPIEPRRMRGLVAALHNLRRRKVEARFRAAK